ncbi:MAG: hypothetical protein ACRDND_22970 [Streptosporangiaceae bacterium]
MRRRLLVMAPILACVTLAGCTGGSASSAARHAAPAARPVTGPAGSPGNPQVFSCAEESFLAGPMPQMPEPGDLAIGPLVIVSGNKLANADPAGWGEHGSYKIPFFVTGGSTVTVTIDPPARGHVVIDNPYARHGVTAASYHSCAHVAGFYAQGFTFTDGRIRGCVPLEVRVADQARVQRVTLSLFAGSCAV